MSSSPLTFGIYAGSYTSPNGGVSRTPDDPARIQDALERLQGGTSLFLVRGYKHYTGPLAPVKTGLAETPANVEQYMRAGRKLDLVLCFRQPDLEGWQVFIRQTIRRYGPLLSTVQITEEANVTTVADVDGYIPHVREALVQGVIAAKAEIQQLGLDSKVGFNAALNFDPSDDFWPAIFALGGEPFLAALDYVGLDFFPDVFRPLAPDGSAGDVRSSVKAVLAHFRQVSLAAAHIPTTCPLYITENGWPTGPTRSHERQADVLEVIVRTIYEHREQYNITHYEFFSLRDADSANPNLFSQFGLLHDDYSPKPAFNRYRQLIAELGQ